MKRRAKPIQPKLRLRDRRRRMMWIKICIGVALLLALIGAAFYVVRLPSLMIADVEVVGAELADAEKIQTLVEQTLAGSYVYIIPRANAFFVPRENIQKAVLSAFPMVSTVTLSHRELETLIVTIGERQPAAEWCTSAEEGEDGYCFLMDAGGFIYVAAEPTDDYIRYISSIEGEPIGTTYLPEEFAALNEFVLETAQTIGRSADSVTVDSNNDAFLSFVGGGVLRFVRTDDSRATLDNITSVFGSQSFKSGRQFEYADFRYGNKVYVKFVGE